MKQPPVLLQETCESPEIRSRNKLKPVGSGLVQKGTLLTQQITVTSTPQSGRNGPVMRIGYTRVSTDKQTLFQSEEALRQAGCDKIFSDFAVSATAKKRPGLIEARAALKSGDTFVVLSIDRAFRSTIEGLTVLDELHKQGITFHSIWQNIDTTTPEGRKWFTYAVADAEYEKAVISRRTKLAMQAAKDRGVKFGRKTVMTPAKQRRASKLLTEGCSGCEIARKLDISRSTMFRYAREAELMAS